jgi:hypothetical protein
MPCSGKVTARCPRVIEMKTSTTQTRIPRPMYRKIAVALALASVVGSTSLTLALSKDRDDDRGEHGDRGWHKGWRGEERGHRDEPRYRPLRQEQEPYHYSRPVYVPPPVYYPPQPSLGISLFLPIDLR